MKGLTKEYSNLEAEVLEISEQLRGKATHLLPPPAYLPKKGHLSIIWIGWK